MSKKRIYIPVNFTVEPKTTIELIDCIIRPREGYEHLSMNVFLDRIKGDLVLEDCEIYVDEDPLLFIDKIEYYFQKEEERLLL